MTEQEWLECTDPMPMLEYLLAKHLANNFEMRQVASRAMRGRNGWARKFRLYACGWCRRFWNNIQDRRLRNAVAITEEYADGLVNDTEFRTAKRQARAAYAQALTSQGELSWEASVASLVMHVMSRRFIPGWNPHRDSETGKRSENTEREVQELMRFQSGLLRDLFGPLAFRPITIDPRWLTSTVIDLAQAIYDEHAFERMPILADALMDAGCDSEEIIAHCRSDGPHVRGCHVVDLLLGKG